MTQVDVVTQVGSSKPRLRLCLSLSESVIYWRKFQFFSYTATFEVLDVCGRMQVNVYLMPIAYVEVLLNVGN